MRESTFDPLTAKDIPMKTIKSQNLLILYYDFKDMTHSMSYKITNYFLKSYRYNSNCKLFLNLVGILGDEIFPRFVGFDGFGAAGFVEMAQCHTEGIGRVEMWVDVFFWNVENAA